MKATLILGAGFSKNSYIPLQSEIPGLLIKDYFSDPFEMATTRVLKEFMEDVFGYKGSSHLPSLDDIFTCIDISTNSGHHLGIGYSPRHLRAVRRFLVYRVFSILEERFMYSKDVKELITQVTETFNEVSYVVLNWDNVLERYLLLTNSNIVLDYCNRGSSIMDNQSLETQRRIKILKLHGSSNWIYCDNCRMLYNDLYNDISIKERAGFQKGDLELFDIFEECGIRNKKPSNSICKMCKNEISSHIATFSYRKTFRSNSFPDVWNAAEQQLSDSDRWIFIGYSLPEADYEFKHLLKISQLKMQHIWPGKLRIDVILLDDKNAIDKYKSFFGDKLNMICNNGINEYFAQ